MRVPWNEDMRVKFPATVQFMRLGYEYQSLKDADIHPETRIFLNRFAPAIQRINRDKNLTVEQILATIEEIHGIIKNNDMGKEFLGRLLDQTADIKLIDFDHPEDNDFAVVDELTFGPEAKGSFRPDINILVNGIANALSVVEAKIDNNNAIATELEDMAKDLYDYWFVQFDFPDENGKPYKSSGGKMVWNEELKREIPEEWEVDRLGKHIISSRGISYNSANLEGDGVPMINLASFGVDSNYKPAGIKTYNGQYDADKILYPFDLIMCNTQQTAIDPTKDIIGKAVLVPDIFDGDVVSSHHVTTITPDVDELKYYLYGTCKTTWFHKYIVGFASGTNILGLDFKGFEDYLMPLPPMRLLKKFATAMKNIESEKNLIITENAELASLRDFLLPMLMNGQVKVKGA